MSNNFGLDQQTCTRLRSVFKKYPNIKKVLIYGSRAKGTQKPGSDIDLAVVGDHLSFEGLNHIKSELDDLMLPYVIDISILDGIQNQDLTNHIKRVGVEFYSRSCEGS